MSPREVLLQWIEAYNDADAERIANLYEDSAINYQEANTPIRGKQAIRKVFQDDFNATKITCIVENIFEDGEWAILEWSEPMGLRGCDFFQINNDKIIFQRAYWDKSSILKHKP